MRKKKMLILFLLAPVILSVSLFAGGRKNFSIIGTAGNAVSDFKGVTFDVGAEIRTLGNFYLQFMFDYYLNPTNLKTAGIDDSAYGFNLYGVYKFRLSKKMNAFVKLGLNYTTLRVSASSGGVTASNSDFGAGAGIGLEFALSESMGFQLGGTAKALASESGAGTWFNMYAGFVLRF